MPKWIEILAQERRLFDQRREIERLRQEVARLKAQNERTQAAMRRCVPCEYRVAVVGRRPPQPGGQEARVAEAASREGPGEP